MDRPLTVSQFWDALSEWSQATFGTDAERGPAGPLKHLLKEIEEVRAAPADIEEYADLLFLTCDAARRGGRDKDILGPAVESASGMASGPPGVLLEIAGAWAQGAIGSGGRWREYGAIVTLALAAAYRAGFSHEQLMAAVTAKLDKNRKRKWGRPSGDEPVEHVRD